jgi:hypothetical protein
MAKVMIMAQCENATKWETEFKKHGELFKAYTTPTVTYGLEGDWVCVFVEPTDLDTCIKMIKSPDTQAAMAQDGIKGETVKMFVLDKNIAL